MRPAASKDPEVERRSGRQTADLEAIDRFLAGDREAFGEVVSRYQDRLFAVLVGILGHLHEAEDVLQEVFVKAYRGLPGFQRESQLYTWLYRIAVNTALSRRRTHRRRGPVVSLDQEIEGQGALPTPVDRTRPVPEEVEATEEVDRVRQAIGELDPDHRTVLVLKDIDGMSYDEIAAVVGCPVGTVKSRIHRARMALRKHLEAGSR